ncbi:MAG: hypothetical protein ETSY1_25945 [Candidatus Entotheonella factor]|uniref:Uncharacterized protein n=1 Tax=Entotheonella factor TaxID=1429438 RepID=W4LFW1_ENTF1|nr:MAG: hypothetical protein ETSY1_25945 [Candidatus Entotheonella factor]
MRQILMGCGLAVLAFLAVSSYAIWQDGKKWAATQKPARFAPIGIVKPGYSNPERFQWKTPEVLKDYVQSRRAAILQEIEQGQEP